MLKGCAPINITSKDQRGWGNGNYTVTQSYVQLISQMTPLPKDKIWKYIWSNDSPPKVNSFFFILALNKLLIGENLLKRNMYGPYRCELFGKATENSHRIFLLCLFTTMVWKTSLQNLHTRIRWSVQPKKFFLDWVSRYQETSKNPLFKAIFKSLPKFICWKLWLARNQITFSNVHTPTEMVDKKDVGLLEEFFSYRYKTFPPTPISTPKSEWINSFFFPPSPTSPLPLPSRSNWQLHEEADYLGWCNTHQSHILYFDGASKGNPRVVGAGEVIIYP